MFPFRTVELLPALRSFLSFLHLTEKHSNFSCGLFQDALGLQPRAIRQLSCFFPDLAFYFMEFPNGLIFSAGLHHNYSFGQVCGSQTRRAPPEKLQGPWLEQIVERVRLARAVIAFARLCPEGSCQFPPATFIVRDDLRVCTPWLTRLVRFAQASVSNALAG